MTVIKSDRNQLWNVSNPHQGKAHKVLAVCSAGLLRSPTTAVVLNREYGYNTRAAGLVASHALIPVSEALLEWADEVVVMEQWMYEELKEELYNEETKKWWRPLLCLNVPDQYAYMDENLQAFILNAYNEAISGVK